MTNRKNPQKIVRPDAQNLASAAAEAGKRGLPPVHLWDPPDCGEIDMRIAADGTWFYQGTPIGRPEMVRLFATILRRDGDRHVLVTPVEKVGIVVDDAPFIAVDFTVEGEGRTQRLTFDTNVGDLVTASADHRLVFRGDPEAGEVVPYVDVRRGLEARVDRKSFYRLAERLTQSEVEGRLWRGLWSDGVFFAMVPEGSLDK